MTRVLVTGGTGVLGRRIVRELSTRGATVRVLSRRPSTGGDGIERVQGDLANGTALDAAFATVDVVVHAATSQKPGEERRIARQVVDEARRAGVRHVVYVSIVGIDTLGFVRYYAEKREGERLFESSGLPYSIQRAAQFHDFVAFLLGLFDRSPLLVLPRNVKLQPVDPDAVATRIARAALGEPAGRLPDLVGPEVRTIQDLMRTWLDAQGRQRRTLSVPLPVPLLRAMSSGMLVSEGVDHIGTSWEEWLKTQSSPNAYHQTRGSRAT